MMDTIHCNAKFIGKVRAQCFIPRFDPHELNRRQWKRKRFMIPFLNIGNPVINRMRRKYTRYELRDATRIIIKHLITL